MKYEQPMINALGSPQRLVQGGGRPKANGGCWDTPGANHVSSAGAYEIDE